ncbi:UPF0236 family protein [Terrilactibacillus sp. S3-3]|nr:UPF0236 family protein [Terrilactibacillus sp. S3-3]
MSHSTVMASVRRVGAAQGQMDEALVEKDKAGTLMSEGRMVTHLMTEADGTYVRGMQKKAHIEIKHLITYEGWEQNGKRRRLVNPYAVMTAKNVNDFWDQATAVAESRYDLTHTQVVANSDGGSGYGEERFKEAFSGSRQPLFVQLDDFHVCPGPHPGPAR